MGLRERVTRVFLWITVLVAGPLVGAKLFDLVVLAGAWSASPPASLKLLPYGADWPVDTGVFFIPFSAAMLVSSMAALAFGWTTPWRYRWLLCLPALGLLTLLVLTVVAFWPMNAQLYWFSIGSPKSALTPNQAVAMTHRWIMLDWVRVLGGSVGFIAAVRAISIPYPVERARPDAPIVKGLLALFFAGVAGFVVWFVSNA